MSEFTRGQFRDNATFVLLNPIFCYGWKTVDLAARIGVSAADLKTELGHMTPLEADAIANRVMVTGANSPKPGRVVKRDRTAPISQPSSTSTFLAYDKLSAATTAGWTLAKQARRVSLSPPVDGIRSMTAIAELSNGVLYAWPLNRADYDQFGASLGLQSALQINTTLERRKLVTGSRTKPGKAVIRNSGGEFSSFYSTDAEDTAIAAGFSIIKGEFIEFEIPAGT
ncbi:hypothetical protein PGN35_000400 [Nodosilinea sp. PGN35]|uniref:hypothetical protein n=1 Tax=Nodosilinea sp. PGN35 TaxID=3020489 RepID=UPI0023B2B69F|nr:hypothetical protein [Nodosilinea sp. TSF1-S3]MDF0369126.1 hypothetical protein [Nodosilinea sp. TSF1-S3]